MSGHREGASRRSRLVAIGRWGLLCGLLWCAGTLLAFSRFHSLRVIVATTRHSWPDLVGTVAGCVLGAYGAALLVPRLRSIWLLLAIPALSGIGLMLLDAMHRIPVVWPVNRVLVIHALVGTAVTLLACVIRFLRPGAGETERWCLAVLAYPTIAVLGYTALSTHWWASSLEYQMLCRVALLAAIGLSGAPPDYMLRARTESRNASTSSAWSSEPLALS